MQRSLGGQEVPVEVGSDCGGSEVELDEGEAVSGPKCVRQGGVVEMVLTTSPHRAGSAQEVLP